MMLVGFLNIVTFMVFTIANRGDAGSGKIEGGRYYVGSHSRYTEVSPLVFQISRWQSSSILITQPLMFVGMFICYRHEKGQHAKAI